MYRVNPTSSLHSSCNGFEFVKSAVCLALVATVGCSGGPSRIDVPSFDASGSADRAMAAYDANNDGFLDANELGKAPGLKAGFGNVDADKDGKVTAQEIADRISFWLGTRVGLMTLSCEVTLDGAALDGAKIRFVPEEFLGDAIQESEDVTNMLGTANPRIPTDKRVSADMPPGIQMGYYRVEISKQQGGKELIPARYNSATILGQEVARDDPAILSNRVRFNLRSK